MDKHNLSNRDLNAIARTAVPLLLLMVVMVAILAAFTKTATFLPDKRRPGPG